MRAEVDIKIIIKINIYLKVIVIKQFLVLTSQMKNYLKNIYNLTFTKVKNKFKPSQSNWDGANLKSKPPKIQKVKFIAI